MKLKKVQKVEAVIDSGITLKGLTPDQISEVKGKLTYANPGYATVQRYSRYVYTTVPPYLTYYDLTKSGIKVPVGYDLSHYNLGTVEDNRVYEKIETAPFVLTPRGSQAEAAENYLTMNKDFTLKGSVQMPTGKGKTILGLYLASQLSCRTLVVVHKDDLVTGWNNDIKLAFDGKVNPGLIKAKSRRVGHFITVATVQTLNRLSPEELESLYSQFGFVIQDEMHHCPATSFEVVSKFRARYKLGLTATPERTDGLEHVMTLYFGDFCYRYKQDNLEDEKDILPAKVIVRNLDYYFNPMCKKHKVQSRTIYKISEFTCPEGKKPSEREERLSEIPYELRPKVRFQTIDDFVVKGIKESVCNDILREYDKGHSCIVFFSQKEHCRLYYEELLQSIPESHLGLYYGDNKDNDSVIKKAESTRKFVTLTTYAKATEGTNVKQWEVEFLVSSINNEKNTEQAVGRIRRVKEGKKISPVLVYDYRTPKAYGTTSHGRTRDSRYRKLHFTFEGVRTRGLFSRGFTK